VSGENVQLAYRFAEAFNAGLDEFIALHADDVVHVTAPEWPERGTYCGRDEVRRLWESIFVDYGDHQILVDEVIPIDEHRVLSKLRWRAKGTSSGAETTTRIYTVGTERDGLVSRIEYFLDYRMALETAGLSE
jgi:ketosteroid isomerase-like protein